MARLRHTMLNALLRRYQWKLYCSTEQAETLHTQRMMIADLWNALLERRETIRRRTVQRQKWWDGDWKLVEWREDDKQCREWRPVDGTGRWHYGESTHSLIYETIRYKHGERAIVPPGKNNKPKPFTAIDMKNEITWMLNQLPEWRAMSVWSAMRVADMVAYAFDGFYQRVKEQQRTSSADRQKLGYPRYKKREKHAALPHRFASGCKLVRDPRHANSWQLTLKGVPGIIHARGRLPADATEWTHADIIWRDETWWLSACVSMEPRRSGGRFPTEIEFDLLTGFARVNGKLFISENIAEIQAMQDVLDALKSERDLRWPRGVRRSTEQESCFLEAQAEISRLGINLRRRRADVLHVWTSRIVRRASELKIVMPTIKEKTKSPRGDEKRWGANVDSVSKINRHVLSQASGMAVSMLRYKAEEAGISCIVLNDRRSLAIGPELVVTGKVLRKARQAARRSST